MRVEQKHGSWWIVEIPDCDDCGPYSTKAEAESDRRGMERFYKYADKPWFVCSGQFSSSNGSTP